MLTEEKNGMKHHKFTELEQQELLSCRHIARIKGRKMFNTQGAEVFNNVSDTLRKYGVNDSSYYRRKPTENGQIESFNGTMLNEILREVEFVSVREAREELEKWREKYNNERPHSALKY